MDVARLISELSTAVEAAENASTYRKALNSLTHLLEILPADDLGLIDALALWEKAWAVLESVDMAALPGLETAAAGLVAAAEYAAVTADDVETLNSLIARSKASRTTILPRVTPRGEGSKVGTAARPLTLSYKGEQLTRGRNWNNLTKVGKAFAAEHGLSWESALTALNAVKGELMADNPNTASFAVGEFTVTRN